LSLAELLTPDWQVDLTLAELPLDRLLARPVKALVLDVDRTLLPRHHATLPDTARCWLQNAMGHLPLHLLSNNPSRRRIAAVASPLGIPFTTAASKPRCSALRKVLNQLGLTGADVALIGDRVFTDVLAGNRLGLFTVLVKPIDPHGRPCRHDHIQRLEVALARMLGGTLA
jgi:HAD superfamily phosphatase (TIGR01668 family)